MEDLISRCPRFMTPWIVIVVICEHDKFLKDDQIEIRFGKLDLGPKRNFKFIDQAHPTINPKIRAFLRFLKSTF